MSRPLLPLLLVLALAGCQPASPVATAPQPVQAASGTADGEPPAVKVDAPLYPGAARTDAKTLSMASGDGSVWQHNVEELQSPDPLDKVFAWYQGHMKVAYKSDEVVRGKRVIQLSDQASPEQRPAQGQTENWVQLQHDDTANKTIVTITSMRQEPAPK